MGIGGQLVAQPPGTWPEVAAAPALLACALFPANQRHLAPRDAGPMCHQLLQELLPCSGHAWLALVRPSISGADSPICLLLSSKQCSRQARVRRTCGLARAGGQQSAQPRTRPAFCLRIRTWAGCSTLTGTEETARGAAGEAAAAGMGRAVSQELLQYPVSLTGTDEAAEAGLGVPGPSESPTAQEAVLLNLLGRDPDAGDTLNLLHEGSWGHSCPPGGRGQRILEGLQHGQAKEVGQGWVWPGRGQ